MDKSFAQSTPLYTGKNKCSQTISEPIAKRENGPTLFTARSGTSKIYLKFLLWSPICLAIS